MTMLFNTSLPFKKKTIHISRGLAHKKSGSEKTKQITQMRNISSDICTRLCLWMTG